MKIEKDSFFTIEKPAEGLFKDKGSKFLSYAIPVKDENEIKTKLEELRKKYHDARHHCYAWRLGTSDQQFRVNDDGEPHNSAGKPILGQIQSFKLTNILVIVVRYFGGTLLGVSGLVHAYKTASFEALKNAIIIEKYFFHVIKIKFGYNDMNHVMKVIKDMGLEHFDHITDQKCEVKVKVRSSGIDSFNKQFQLYPEIKTELILIE